MWKHTGIDIEREVVRRSFVEIGDARFCENLCFVVWLVGFYSQIFPQPCLQINKTKPCSLPSLWGQITPKSWIFGSFPPSQHLDSQVILASLFIPDSHQIRTTSTSTAPFELRHAIGNNWQIIRNFSATLIAADWWTCLKTCINHDWE